MGVVRVEMMRKMSSLWHNTPPRGLSRFSDVSTISGQDQSLSFPHGPFSGFVPNNQLTSTIPKKYFA